MSDWDQKAEDSTAGRGYRTADEAWAHVAGARWQRDALLSDETVERVARALNAEGWTCGWCEPDEYDTCDDCKNAIEQAARAALRAAIGDDDE